MKRFDSVGYRAKRARVLALLGNKCSFEGCTWDHPDVLEIDHINPLNNKENRISGYFFLDYVLKMEDPKQELQLLCANHHKLKTIRDLEDIQEYKSSLRQLDTQGV